MAMDGFSLNINPLDCAALFEVVKSPEAKAVLTLALTYAANQYLGAPPAYGVLLTVAKYGYDCFNRENNHTTGAPAPKAKFR